jgi:hypothetical protein
MPTQNRPKIAVTASIIFDAPYFTLIRLMADLGFKPTSLALENGFIGHCGSPTRGRSALTIRAMGGSDREHLGAPKSRAHQRPS